MTARWLTRRLGRLGLPVSRGGGSWAARGPALGKYEAEVAFWRRFLEQVVAWWRGELKELYRTPSPPPAASVRGATEQDTALLTWLELHQKPKYLADLELDGDAFAGRTVLDVGSGPFPSAEAFSGCRLYCLDPLLPAYLEAGYPLHYCRAETRFVHCRAEAIRLASNSVDAVLSVNALDHVDDFEAAAAEIGRVLRPGGVLRLHLHYHPPTRTEPLELDDERVAAAFSWCEGFRKLAERRENTSTVAAEGESFALWGSGQ